MKIYHFAQRGCSNTRTQKYKQEQREVDYSKQEQKITGKDK